MKLPKTNRIWAAVLVTSHAALVACAVLEPLRLTWCLPAAVLINDLVCLAFIHALRKYTIRLVRHFFLLCIVGGVLLPFVYSSHFTFPFVMLVAITGMLPAAVVTALLSLQFGESKRFRVAYAVGLAAIVLLVLKPMFVKHAGEYPPESPATFKDDLLVSKNPPLIDAPAHWERIRPDAEAVLEINRTAAVVSLDLSKVERWEEYITEQRFSSYREAAAFMYVEELAWLPSTQMVDQKVKAFSDAAYAAIDQYTQRDAAQLGGGRQAFLESLLKPLLADGAQEAAAFVAAALKLSGKEPDLPGDVNALSEAMKDTFLQDAFASKPIGYYTESEALQRIFQQNRFCQQNLRRIFNRQTATTIATGIARVLKADPSLAAAYTAILNLQAKTTNPPEVGFESLYDYDPSGAGSNASLSLFPPSGSRENTLYGRIYDLMELPSENVMNRLIQAIRSGEVDLKPDNSSGWYDYQVHALETLLLPERAQESQKLLLSAEYKKRLRDAFETALTKLRELHIGHLGAAESAYYPDGNADPIISVEPTATVYLRTARALRFLESAVTTILGEAAWGSIQLDDGKRLADELPTHTQLLYGVYLQVCDDLGMPPQLLTDERSPAAMNDAREQAQAWLESCGEDPTYKKDVRYIVPVLRDAAHTDVRYWMTTGIRLRKVKAEYAREPTLRVNGAPLAEDKSPYDYGVSFDSPKEFYLPVEEFAEATGPNAPYTRDEFRALCDRAETTEAIIKAIEHGPASIRAPHLVAVLVMAGLLGITGYYFKFSRSRRPSTTGVTPNQGDTT